MAPSPENRSENPCRHLERAIRSVRPVPLDSWANAGASCRRRSSTTLAHGGMMRYRHGRRRRRTSPDTARPSVRLPGGSWASTPEPSGMRFLNGLRSSSAFELTSVACFGRADRQLCAPCEPLPRFCEFTEERTEPSPVGPHNLGCRVSTWQRERGLVRPPRLDVAARHASRLPASLGCPSWRPARGRGHMTAWRFSNGGGPRSSIPRGFSLADAWRRAMSNASAESPIAGSLASR